MLKRKANSGIALSMVILFIVIMTVLATVMVSIAMASMSRASIIPKRDSHHYAAEAAINRAIPWIAADIREDGKTVTLATAIQYETAVFLDGVSIPPGADSGEIRTILEDALNSQSFADTVVAPLVRDIINNSVTIPPFSSLSTMPLFTSNLTDLTPSLGSEHFRMISAWEHRETEGGFRYIPIAATGFGEPAFVNFLRNINDENKIHVGVEVVVTQVGARDLFNVALSPYVIVVSEAGSSRVMEVLSMVMPQFNVSVVIESSTPEVSSGGSSWLVGLTGDFAHGRAYNPLYENYNPDIYPPIFNWVRDFASGLNNTMINNRPGVWTFQPWLNPHGVLRADGTFTPRRPSPLPHGFSNTTELLIHDLANLTNEQAARLRVLTIDWWPPGENIYGRLDLSRFVNLERVFIPAPLMAGPPDRITGERYAGIIGPDPNALGRDLALQGIPAIVDGMGDFRVNTTALRGTPGNATHLRMHNVEVVAMAADIVLPNRIGGNASFGNAAFYIGGDLSIRGATLPIPGLTPTGPPTWIGGNTPFPLGNLSEAPQFFAGLAGGGSFNMWPGKYYGFYMGFRGEDSGAMVSDVFSAFNRNNNNGLGFGPLVINGMFMGNTIGNTLTGGRPDTSIYDVHASRREDRMIVSPNEQVGLEAFLNSRFIRTFPHHPVLGNLFDGVVVGEDVGVGVGEVTRSFSIQYSTEGGDVVFEMRH